jgi:hypothetical protein
MDRFNSFVTLIEEQPELFSPKDSQDLQQRVANWSADKDDLEDAIANWIEARQPIRDALNVLSAKEKERKNLLPGNGKSAPTLKEKDYKPMLINAIHRSLSTSPQPAIASKK